MLSVLLLSLGVGVVPLDLLLDAAPVYPSRSHGFAAYIVGGFFGMGVLILAMILLSMRPKRVQRDPDKPPY